MRRIAYRGRTVAFARGRRVRLTAAVGLLAPADGLRRFVVAMCAFSAAVDGGAVPGDYTHARAERFARMLLIPLEELLPRLDEPPPRLAEIFGVPVEQVERRLLELRYPWPQAGL